LAYIEKSRGDALFLIGERERDTDKLNQAIRAYSVVLEVATQEQAPVKWAQVQNNRGAVFRTLGELTNDSGYSNKLAKLMRLR